MRLKLGLTIINSKELPINYNYPLSAAIYNLLRFGSPEFATYLHDFGFLINGKKYKLFTFALKINRFKISGDKFIFTEPKSELFVSSPKIDEFIQSFVIGTFANQEIKIHINYKDYIFTINQVEALPEPEFCDVMKFKLLAPMVLATGAESSKGIKAKYLRYHDDPCEINRILSMNLRNKYTLITGKQITPDNLLLDWDSDYIQRTLKAGKKLTSKITIDRSYTKIDVVGIKAPFTLTGSKELIKTGYQCGFGEKNSMGFGMAEIITNEKL